MPIKTHATSVVDYFKKGYSAVKIASTQYQNTLNTTLKITMLALCILNLNIFGTVGLVGYGLLIALDLIMLLVNYKHLTSFRSPIKLIGIFFFLSYLLSISINGNFPYMASTIGQFLLITILCFQQDSTDKIQSNVSFIAKTLTIIGIINASCSYLVSFIYSDFPNTVASIANIYPYFNQIGSPHDYRLVGLQGNPNNTSAYMYISALMALYIFTTQDLKWKIIATCDMILAFLIIIISSNSRTSTIALVVGFTIYLLTYFLVIERDNKEKRKIFFILLLILLICILAFIILLVANPQFKDYFFTKIIRIDSLKTGSSRDQVYEIAIKLWKENLLFGYNRNEIISRRELFHTHNNCLEILSFGGIITFVLWLLYFIYTNCIGIKMLLSSKFNKELKQTLCLMLSILISHIFWGLTEVDIDWMKVSSLMIFTFIPTIIMLQSYSNGSTS